VQAIPARTLPVIVYNSYTYYIHNGASQVERPHSTPIRQPRLLARRRRYFAPHAEIIEYARFIGLVLPEDSKYLYVAKEGLKAPLPPFW
jgi:hypothetical protein